MPKWVSVSRSYRWMESELVPCRRGHWWPRFDVFFAALSLTFDVGFLSTVPMLMLMYGGGLLLIGIALALVFIAYPLMNIEMSLGQFGSAGAISIWNLCPLFKGIGYGMVLLSFMMSVHYSYLASWPLHYLATAVLNTDTMPWTSCSNEWNTANCLEVGLKVTVGQQHNGTMTPQPLPLENVTYIIYRGREAASEYFRYRFLAQNSSETSLSNIGAVQWEILIALSTFWVFIYLMLIVGHYSLGKASYFTTLVPLGLVIAFLVKVVPLEGAIDGLLHVLTIATNDVLIGLNAISMTSLMHMIAVTSPLLGFGCFTTLGSYNRLQYNYHRDSILVIIFSFLFNASCIALTAMCVGRYAYLRGVSMGEAMEMGDKLLYVTMPTLLSSFEAPKLWLCLYFTLVFFLMFGTQLVITETIVTAIADEFFPVRLTKGKRMLFKSLLTLAFCLLMILIGIPLSTQGGFEIALFLLTNVTTFSPFMLILLTCAVLVWIYGVVQYSYDVKVMLGYKPDYLILGCVIGVVPIGLLGTLTSAVYNKISQTPSDTAMKPSWHTPVSWVLSTLPLTLVPILMIVRLCEAAICPQRCGNSKRFCTRVTSPTLRWKRQCLQDVSQRPATIIRTPTAPPGSSSSSDEEPRETVT